jgi:hypothetical protein
MAIDLKGRPNSTFSFGVFYTSLGSTLCTEFKLTNDLAIDIIVSLNVYLESVNTKSVSEMLADHVRELFEIKTRHEVRPIKM